ncbi:MAG: alpha/beta hydrolase-fold protein, partial [Planctomycetaceae bacterium]
FQFWFYLYPTGEPFWETAADVRADLQAAVTTLAPQNSDAALNKMVVVGHSMGGLVARMLTLSSGDTFWRAVSNTPIDQIRASPETRSQLERTYYFEPSPSVRRVVMIGSPHRGSNLANSVTQWLARNVIYLPQQTLRTARQLLLQNPRMSPNNKLVTPKTSVDGLAPDSPILQAMQQITSDSKVQLHNVIGARNRNHLPDADDGVVTYASAHRDDIESEIIVQSDHSRLHRHPRTIQELHRILMRHLEQAQGAATSGIVHIGKLGHSQPPSERPLQRKDGASPDR